MDYRIRALLNSDRNEDLDLAVVIVVAVVVVVAVAVTNMICRLANRFFSLLLLLDRWKK